MKISLARWAHTQPQPAPDKPASPRAPDSVKVNAVVYARVVALQQVLDVQTDAWDIKIANVEIKHVDLIASVLDRLSDRPKPG